MSHDRKDLARMLGDLRKAKAKLQREMDRSKQLGSDIREPNRQPQKSSQEQPDRRKTSR